MAIETAKTPRRGRRGEGVRVLPDRITIARQQLGISKATLANQVDVSRAFIQQVEDGTSNPSMVVLSAIARILDREVKYFIDPTVEQRPPSLTQELRILAARFEVAPDMPATEMSAVAIRHVSVTLRSLASLMAMASREPPIDYLPSSADVGPCPTSVPE